jgi:hypothetical protein
MGPVPQTQVLAMKNVALAESVSATAVAAQTAVSIPFKTTPFLVGRDVVAAIDPAGVTGSPTFKIQGSVDGTTYTDLLTSTGLGRKEGTIKTYPYMRFNVTAAGTAGVVSASLTNGA